MTPETIQPETLRDLLLKVLNQYPSFKYIYGIQPFLIVFDENKYYVYVKNLSSAFFKDRPDTTRAQLPLRDEFENIKNSVIPFIFLGYDSYNDVLVCWNFHIVKSRLNEKKSVSFYSRQYFQDEVVTNEFLRKELKNTDKPVLFKRKNLIEFFQNIDTFFPTDFSKNDNNKNNLTKIIDENTFSKEGKILRIGDQELVNQLKPIIASGRLLEAVKQVEAYYNNKFPKMTLKDWFNLLKTIDDKSTTYDRINTKKCLLESKHNDNYYLSNQQNTATPYTKISQKRKKHILRVIYPDGKVIKNKIISHTFIEVIQNAGLEKVRDLGIMLNGCNLVSNIVIPTYKRSQKAVGNGLYIMTCCDTNKKQKILLQISDALHLDLVVEKIPI